MPRVFVSGPRDMRTQNNPGNARVFPGLQAPMLSNSETESTLNL